MVAAGFLAVLGAVLLVPSVTVAGRLAEFAVDSVGRIAGLSALWSDAEAMLPWLAVVPAALGLFWGAPLLARGRLIRLGELSGVVVLAGLAVGALLTAPVTGLVLAAWWLLAFWIGTTAGILLVATTLLGGVLAGRAARRGAST